jgi:hypothetical protein
MSRSPRLITAVAVAILLAACGEAGDNPMGPSAAPSFDGGTLVMGGNNTDPDSTTTTSTGTTTTPGSEAPPSDSTSRSPVLVTGGN